MGKDRIIKLQIKGASGEWKTIFEAKISIKSDMMILDELEGLAWENKFDYREIEEVKAERLQQMLDYIKKKKIKKGEQNDKRSSKGQHRQRPY